MTYHYTAVLEGDSVLYAEHFEDEAECQKRARQFASAIVGNDALTLYVGTEPPEAVLAVSLLTAPEVDDSTEARPLPDWAIAQHEVESAGQVVIEAKASVEAHKARHLKAYNANERHGGTVLHGDLHAFGILNVIRGHGFPQAHGFKLRAEAEARRGLDQAEANLYRAENHLADKLAAYEAKKPKEGKKNA